jgi:hypothetical protein
MTSRIVLPDAPKSPLQIAQYHRSEKDARAYVASLKEQFGIKNFGTKLLSDKPVEVPTSDKPMQVNLRREVFTARTRGVPTVLQPLIDNSDPFMPPPMSLGVMGDVSGISFGIHLKIGTFEAKIQGQGIHEAPVTALADDVLYFRRQVVEAAEGHDLPSMARSYRTYLQVCISLVDAFLGHAAFAARQLKSPKVETEAFKTLTGTVRFEDRVSAWCEVCGQSPQTYRSTKARSDLQNLRRERNRYVHPSDPVYTLGVEDIVNVLNLCRDGIGGTLVEFRTMAGLDPRLSYIQKVLTAPVISRNL